MVTELSRNYDPTSPAFHHYQFSDHLCNLGSPNRTVDRFSNSPDKHYVGKNGLAIDIMTFELGRFTINLWYRKTTGAWEGIRKSIVELVGSEFPGAEWGEKLDSGICAGFRH